MHDSPLDLIPGTLELLILRTLAGEPLHGYGISRWIRQRTRDAISIQDAALYQALRRMEGKGWVEAEWGVTETGRRARFYSLTERGEQRLRRELSIWDRYVQAVARVLAPAPGKPMPAVGDAST